MNILIHRYNSICEPDYIDAFKALGIEVIEDTDEMTDKNIPLEKRVARLGETILLQKPMFVFSINFFPYVSLVCEKLGVMYVCVSVDCPVAELFSIQIRNKCNRVFLFDYKQYLGVRDENPECIFYMPLGVNVDRINGTIGEPKWDEQKYMYDVSFVGSLYNEKNLFPQMYEKLSDRYKGMCDGLLAAQELMNGQELLESAITDEAVQAIKVAAGDKFYPSDLSVCSLDRFVAVNDFLSTELTVRDRLNLMYVMANALPDRDIHLFTRSDLSDLKACDTPLHYHGGVKSLTEMPMVFRKSKINLNPTMRSIQTGLSQRVWDVLGSGGFLMTSYQSEIPEYFETGRHLVAYESIEEACELAEYYLSHEDERLEITVSGYELVKTRHTVLNRVAEMIKVIMQNDEVDNV